MGRLEGNMRKQELYGKPYRMMILLALLLLGSCCFSSGDVEDSLSAGGGNQSPNAVLAARAAAQVQLSGEVPFTVNLDGSGSTDPDGMIVDYAWDFDGNGTIVYKHVGPVSADAIDKQLIPALRKAGLGGN